MKIWATTLLTLCVGLSAGAQNFQLQKSIKRQAIDCSAEKNVITFAKTNQKYVLYDQNLTPVKVMKCEKIEVSKDLVFYSVLFGSHIQETSGTQRILIYELAQPASGKSMKTVRSEVVDQVELAGDPASDKFEFAIETQWGQDAKDKSVLLQVRIYSKKEKPEPFYLKYNAKNVWFENVISDTNVKSTHK
ncbi:hypothetical protein [Pseudobdellovibrio exovorus]|uniref:Uncharacterized protein n=1 Tax=Pseudobdellovibrio exovorus JSS TaxID=1184267 RepID=M4V873_9BACT|nr:hypothetical protein [Pseudobdellovibrio exovorus]AGH95413.1 hypothetical protein A11Q_1197 [Pseudobdellovibrio exovorus JSS]